MNSRETKPAGRRHRKRRDLGIVNDAWRTFHRRLKEQTPYIPVTFAFLGLNIFALATVLVMGGDLFAPDIFVLVDAGAV